MSDYKITRAKATFSFNIETYSKETMEMFKIVFGRKSAFIPLRNINKKGAFRCKSLNRNMSKTNGD